MYLKQYINLPPEWLNVLPLRGTLNHKSGHVDPSYTNDATPLESYF